MSPERLTNSLLKQTKIDFLSAAPSGMQKAMRDVHE